MTQITFEPATSLGTRSKGPVTLDTQQLMFGVDGTIYLRSGHDGSLVPLSLVEREVLANHFGHQKWRQVLRSVGVLADKRKPPRQ